VLDKTVVVKYQTQKSYCPCCNQKLPEIETSKTKEFKIDKETAMSWTNWNEVAEYPEDMESMVPEFVHETIVFFSVNTPEKIIIDDSEVEKVKEFILHEVIQ
jgi:hypothetical protein